MNAQQQKPIIGISIGDLNGIGAELVIKTLNDHRLLELCTPVIVPPGNTARTASRGVTSGRSVPLTLETM